jgi:hypothetical protein
MRCCSWDGWRDLVGRRGNARRPIWQRRRLRRAEAATVAASGVGGGSRRRRLTAQAPASGTQEAPSGKILEGVEAAAAET